MTKILQSYIIKLPGIIQIYCDTLQAQKKLCAHLNITYNKLFKFNFKL